MPEFAIGSCEENVKKQTCSGFGEQARYCTEYTIGAQNKSDIAGILAAKIPAVQLGPHNEILSQIEIQNIRRTGQFCYVVSICWSDESLTPDDKVPGQNVSFQFGVQSSNARRGASFATRCITSSNGTANDQTFSQGAPIAEFDSDGQCKIVGCDVLNPNKTYCETHCISRDSAFFNPTLKSYCRKLAMAVGSVNEIGFRNCEPCEMLLTSVSFTRPNIRSDWTANFCWSIAPNVLQIIPLFLGFGLFGGNDPLTPADNEDPQFNFFEVAVGGWDHLQLDTHCYTDSNGISAAVIESIKVHQVYRKFNFYDCVPSSTTLIRTSGTHPFSIGNRELQTAG